MEFNDTLGIRTIRMQDGESRLELQLQPMHMSMAERAHGGVLFTMLDSALGRAVLSSLPEGRGCATVECKINYFRPVRQGLLVATGEVKSRTRSLAYAEGAIVNDDGKVVARASGTFFLTQTLVLSERERL